MNRNKSLESVLDNHIIFVLNVSGHNYARNYQLKNVIFEIRDHFKEVELLEINFLQHNNELKIK